MASIDLDYTDCFIVSLTTLVVAALVSPPILFTPMDDHYGAIKFGEFRKYMQNKQAKLKDQERALYVLAFIVSHGSAIDHCFFYIREHTASQSTLPQIFQGLSIYINGYTNPSQSELRRLIILHGGNYQHYCKSCCSLCIASTDSCT